ncbi:MAG: NAD(P)-dependent oxidoreductase, partial [Bacteroidota bacterium]
MRTAFITGASRGIGKAIGLKLARRGYNIVIAAKTTIPHPKLPGTIFTAAEEIIAAGGKALPVEVDIRNEEMVRTAIQQAVETFGGIDILINNASAISLTQTPETEMKRYDLMQDINVRGTFMVSKYCMPFLEKSAHPHILTMSPPLNLDPAWFGRHLAYTLSKYGMSMTVLGLAHELKSKGIAVNALWPQTAIATAAVRNVIGGDALVEASRKPEIMADAADIILHKEASFTGQFLVDETILREHGVSDFSGYAVNPDKEP